MDSKLDWFVRARYGLFVHYGLYSLLGRGEWVLNRERIPVEEYKALADRFTAEAFDADALLKKAREEWGMRYAILTTKHHEGFCLYDSRLTDFTAPKTAAKRDLVAEFVEACRRHGMRIGLYHSLNDWTCSPSALDALERPEECHRAFIDFVHGQIREIMTNYGKIDIMWYDGWWPFDAEGWRAAELNAMVRDLQPGILVNGRCCLPGDFGTPEGHITASETPWEACMTLNENWGFHRGDHDWKPPKEVAEMLRQCAAGVGNLLLNVGPRGDGSIPEESVRILDAAGEWIRENEEAIFDTARFSMDPHDPAKGNADWMPSGRFSARDKALYYHVRHWPGETFCLGNLASRVEKVTHLATGRNYPFTQEGTRVVVRDVPATMDTSLPVVFRFLTADGPRLVGCGGLRTPTVPYCRYDPIASDIAHGV